MKLLRSIAQWTNRPLEMYRPLKICLIGDFSGVPDEGMKNISHHVKYFLSKKNIVLSINPSRILSIKILKKLRYFQPQIIHYLHGPSIKSFVFIKIIKAYCRAKSAKTLLSAPRPEITKFSKHFVPLFKSDLLLVQSLKSEKFFRSLGCEVQYLLGGVDIKKFVPADPHLKLALRSKYGFTKNQFIVLHVGHFRKRRYIDILSRIKRENIAEVIMVGGTSLPKQGRIYDDLRKSGCKTIYKYLPNIEEYYQIADCFIFPVRDKPFSTIPSLNTGSIEFPLSVIQAMACNLPVLSTKFGALQSCFGNSSGFYYFDSEEEALEILKKIKTKVRPNNNRKLIMKYSWKNMCENLESIYQMLLSG